MLVFSTFKAAITFSSLAILIFVNVATAPNYFGTSTIKPCSISLLPSELFSVISQISTNFVTITFIFTILTLVRILIAHYLHCVRDSNLKEPHLQRNNFSRRSRLTWYYFSFPILSQIMAFSSK